MTHDNIRAALAELARVAAQVVEVDDDHELDQQHIEKLRNAAKAARSALSASIQPEGRGADQPKSEHADYVGWCRFVVRHERPTRLELCDSDADGAFKVYRHPETRATPPDRAAPVFRPMHHEDGRQAWYLDHPDLYCDVEQDAAGKWSIFFKDRRTGHEAFGEFPDRAAASAEGPQDEFARFTAWAKPHLWSDDKAANDLAWLAFRAGAAQAGREEVAPAGWREQAAAWLRRRAERAMSASELTGWANPAHALPDRLHRLADELDAEASAAPYGLEPHEAPIVNKFGDKMRSEVQRFMREATTHLAAQAVAPLPGSTQGEKT